MAEPNEEAWQQISIHDQIAAVKEDAETSLELSGSAEEKVNRLAEEVDWLLRRSSLMAVAANLQLECLWLYSSATAGPVLEEVGNTAKYHRFSMEVGEVIQELIVNREADFTRAAEMLDDIDRRLGEDMDARIEGLRNQLGQ